MFEVTRRIANRTRETAQHFVDESAPPSTTQTIGTPVIHHFPRTVHGLTLVSGGVVAGLTYEFITRPFDIARQAIRSEQLSTGNTKGRYMPLLQNFIAKHGLIVFVRGISPASIQQSDSRTAQKRLYAVLRAVGRAGPWGIGFLVLFCR